MENRENINRLIHNLNSSIASLVQAVEVIEECWPDNPELLDRMIPMTKKRGHDVIEFWESFKEEINNMKG